MTPVNRLTHRQITFNQNLFIGEIRSNAPLETSEHAFYHFRSKIKTRKSLNKMLNRNENDDFLRRKIFHKR